MRIRVHRGQAAYFRKLARESAKEIQAYLVGEVVSPELTVVEKFAYTKKYAAQTPGVVQWYAEDYDKVKREAEEHGKRIIGDVHSHPNWDAVMSPSDYKAHIEEGFRVSGICSVTGRKTRLRFWVSDSALPVKIEYVP